MDYKELYHDLFNTLTDTIENLKEAQLKAEEKYLKMTDDEDVEKNTKTRIIKFKKQLCGNKIRNENKFYL